VASLLLLVSAQVNASLFDRGGGLIYDDVLDITWLQDANYAATELTDARRDDIISTVGSVDGHTLATGDFIKDGSGNYTGTMTWWGAVAWADTLDFGDFNDWRLASISVAAGLPTGSTIPTSPPDGCFEATSTEELCRDNELEYMYYYNLAGNFGDSLEGDQTVNGGTPAEFALNNIQSGYLSGTEFARPDLGLDGNAWHFDFGVGYHFNLRKMAGAASWAVRDGDISPVPVPAAIDIKPGSDPNAVNPKSKGVVPVAVFGSMNFDALQIDFLTVTFGSASASPVHDGHVEDVNGDDFVDMMFHFKTQETGITCGDTDATLTGETFGGIKFTGTDTVKTVGCK